MTLNDLLNVKDVLIDAGIGFVSGFTYGYSGWSPGGEGVREDSLDLLEAGVDKEAMEKVGLNEERIGRVRSMNQRLRRLLPVLAGYPYAFAEHFIRGSYWPGNLISFVGGALAGESIGRVIRRTRKGLTKEDLTALRDIVTNPGNARNYLDNEQRLELDLGLIDIEQASASGREPSERSSARVYHAITSKNKIYTPALIKWSLKEVEKAFKLGLIQSNVKEFFELAPSMSVAFVGNKDGAKFNLYELEGDNLRAGVADFNGVSTLKRDGDPVQYIMNKLSVNYRGDSSVWNREYRSFAKRVRDENKDRGFMLLKSPSGVPEELKKNVLTMAYLKSREKD